MTTIEFNRVEANERACTDAAGDTRDRYQTDWTVGDEQFRVSSVNNSYTTETLIFRIMENGQANMFDVWGDKRWRWSQSQHREILSEYVDTLPLSRYNTRMDTYTNNYIVNNHIEVLVGEHEPGVRQFTVVNTDSGFEEEISENAAKAMCMTPDSTINPDNWEDFCTARGIFTEDH